MGLFSFAESKKFLGLSSASSKGPRYVDVHSTSSTSSSSHSCTHLQLRTESSLLCITGRRLQDLGISS